MSPVRVWEEPPDTSPKLRLGFFFSTRSWVWGLLVKYKYMEGMEDEPKTDLDRLLDLVEAGKGYFVMGAFDTINNVSAPEPPEEPPLLAS